MKGYRLGHRPIPVTSTPGRRPQHLPDVVWLIMLFFFVFGMLVFFGLLRP